MGVWTDRSCLFSCQITTNRHPSQPLAVSIIRGRKRICSSLNWQLRLLQQDQLCKDIQFWGNNYCTGSNVRSCNFLYKIVERNLAKYLNLNILKDSIENIIFKWNMPFLFWCLEGSELEKGHYFKMELFNVFGLMDT